MEVQHVEKNGTQCFKSGSNDKWDNNNEKFDQDESNVIVNTDQKGNVSVRGIEFPSRVDWAGEHRKPRSEKTRRRCRRIDNKRDCIIKMVKY